MSQNVQLYKYVAICVNVTLWDKDLESAVIVYEYGIINVTVYVPYTVIYT